MEQAQAASIVQTSQGVVEEELTKLEETNVLVTGERTYGVEIAPTLGKIRRVLVAERQKGLPLGCGDKWVPQLNGVFASLERAIPLSKVISVTRALYALCKVEPRKGPLPMIYNGYLHDTLAPPSQTCNIYIAMYRWWSTKNPGGDRPPQIVQGLTLTLDESRAWRDLPIGMEEMDRIQHPCDNIRAMQVLEPEWAKAEDDTSLPGFLVRAIAFTGNEFVPIPSFAKNCMRGNKCTLMLKQLEVPPGGSKLKAGTPILLVRLHSLLSHRIYVLLQYPQCTTEELVKGKYE